MSWVPKKNEKLLILLKNHRKVIGYSINDLKGISPTFCTHCIPMEDQCKPVVDHQRRCHTRFFEENQVHTYMHARIKFPAYSDIKVYTENSITKEKERLSEIYAWSWKRRHQTSQEVDWGLRTPCTSNIFTRLQSSILFLSNNICSKGEHLSYSASVGEKNECKGFIVD
jgi:hypothetical protein